MTGTTGVTGMKEGARRVSIMQKAVTPAQSAAILEHGLDRVAGFAVRRDDAAYADRPDELRRLLALDGAGSPFSDDEVDVLIFPTAPTMQFEDAIGGTTREELHRTGGTFLERAPFLGTGFAPVDHAVPVWWLSPTRVAAGTRLVRFRSSGDPVVLAEYPDVATGWLVPGQPGRLPAVPSGNVGTYVAIDGGYRLADRVDDHVVIYEPSTGERVERPLADVEELFELQVLGTWNGLPVRVVARWDQDGEALARCVCLAHDADLAEGLGLERVEAGVYELTVPESSIDGLRTVKLEVPEGR